MCIFYYSCSWRRKYSAVRSRGVAIRTPVTGSSVSDKSREFRAGWWRTTGPGNRRRRCVDKPLRPGRTWRKARVATSKWSTSPITRETWTSARYLHNFEHYRRSHFGLQRVACFNEIIIIIIKNKKKKQTILLM